MNRNDPRLQKFVDHLIVTMLWSSTGVDDEDFDQYGIADVSEDTRELLESIAHVFLTVNRPYIEKIDEDGNAPSSPDGSDIWAMAGHDFWLTAVGHGAGFWDGDWPEPYGDTLTKSAKSIGGFLEHLALYVDADETVCLG